MKWLLFLLLFGIGLSAGAAEAPDQKATQDSLPSCFGELTEVPLPKSLEWARDVRWVGEKEVAIAAFKAGVVSLRLDRPEKPPVTEVPEGPFRSATWASWSIGASPQYLAVGSVSFAVGWKSAETAGLSGEDYFEVISDVDVQGKTLLVLGLRKNEDGSAYAEEGAFAWLGPLGGPNLDAMRPVAFSTDGARARPWSGCSPIHVGAARFLESGSFVVVPVAEAGVLLFGADGRLKRAWQDEIFGLNGGCDLSEKQYARLGIDLAFRMEWVNQHDVVDDILPLGSDIFGLLVRHHEAGTTRWRMEIADSNGRIGACEVPLAAQSRWVHLRASRRNDRVVLLQITRFDEIQPARPAVQPRLFVAPITEAHSVKRKTP